MLKSTYFKKQRPVTRMVSELLQSEIAFVLFMDIVEYSLQPMKEQRRVRAELKTITSTSPEYCVALANNSIISRSTGDGIALVFFNDPEAPLRCAIEISQEIKRRGGPAIRIGIHSGPVYRDTDINEERDVAGGGINTAQRVMDFGDTGHILFSRAMAEILIQLGDWRPFLFSLGEVEVKHGEKLSLYNFHSGQVGNPNPPKKLNIQRRGRKTESFGNVGTSSASPWSVGTKAGGADQLPKSKPAPEDRHNRYCDCGMMLPKASNFCVHCGRS